MALDTLTLAPGDFVTYSDMANPTCNYQVIEKVTDRWGTFFRLIEVGERWDSPSDLKTSDCRQYGWNLVS